MAKVKIQSKSAFGKDRKSKSKTQNVSLNSIPLPKKSRSSKKRIGQGPGSGMGKTSTRGQKGQKARASSMRRGFEGGQMPLHRRLPKRGFTSVFHKEYQPVNLEILARFNLTGGVTPKILEDKGIIKDSNGLIKILGNGEIKSAVNITADKFSKSAEEKIKKAGGSIELRVKGKAK